MSLIDIINKVPLALASKVVEKTKKSKYTLAQVCNFAATMPALFTALDAYQNNMTSGTVIGGSLVMLNGWYVYTNTKLKETEAPDFAEKVTKKVLSKTSAFSEGELKNAFEKIQEQFEKRNAKRALFQVLTGAGLGVLSYKAYSVMPENPTELAKNIALYTGLLGSSVVLGAMAHYFRAVPKKK